MLRGVYRRYGVNSEFQTQVLQGAITSIRLLHEAPAAGIYGTHSKVAVFEPSRLVVTVAVDALP